ncbi:MAG: helix-turn-helix transcriptional regulator [Candidatus Pacebacteria bacterium]|nr:helix-turn-helix transcriptional regulator [Candidatus Paceibacterota bacterium]
MNSTLKNKPKIPNRIRYCRKMAGLNQRELAFLMNKPLRKISRWEKGERTPNIYHCIGLAVAMHRLVDDLFSDYRREWIERIRQRNEAMRQMPETIKQPNKN